LFALGAALYLSLLEVLRHAAYPRDPLLFSYAAIASMIIAFAYSGNALVRFRAIPDRAPLILAFSILGCGLIEGGWSITGYRLSSVGTPPLSRLCSDGLSRAQRWEFSF
jgi:hypothetical protein